MWMFLFYWALDMNKIELFGTYLDMVLTDTQKFLYFLLVDNLHHHMLEPDYRIYEYDDVDRHHSYVNNETKGSMFPILHLLDKGHGYKHVPTFGKKFETVSFCLF